MYVISESPDSFHHTQTSFLHVKKNTGEYAVTITDKMWNIKGIHYTWIILHFMLTTLLWIMFVIKFHTAKDLDT